MVVGDGWASALALVQLLPGQPGERDHADADQNQQGGEECLKHERAPWAE
ncbi:hypothetical protein GZL_04146 [Streptomyces sp. 769]|nr:hypothetical protein GZL_04146 [Streptomyces sp. 769]